MLPSSASCYTLGQPVCTSQNDIVARSYGACRIDSGSRYCPAAALDAAWKWFHESQSAVTISVGVQEERCVDGSNVCDWMTISWETHKIAIGPTFEGSIFNFLRFGV